MSRAPLIAAVALATLLGGGLALWASGPLDANPIVLKALGPPAKELREVHAEEAPEAAAFSHATFDRLLKAHVREGRVDYRGLSADRADLDAYLAELADAPFEGLGRDAKLALLINAYNAFTLALILEHYPLASIKDIPEDQRWDAVRWELAGRRVSLSQIEHEELRSQFAEPRIHFAINCASIGCPPLRDEAYIPERLDAQLEEATQALHDDARWLQANVVLQQVQLTKLYAWYEGDFTQVAGSPIAFAARYRPELAGGAWTVDWLPYDWGLNDLAGD